MYIIIMHSHSMSFDLEPIGDIYNNELTKKQCRRYCCIAMSVVLVNMLCIIGGCSMFYYIYLGQYINNVDEVIQGTILEDKDKTKQLLVRLPKVVNLLCNVYGC